MNDVERLERVKALLGIPGAYHDATISGYIADVMAFMRDSGVNESVVQSESAVGAIARGVSDLWNNGAGSVNFSPYFMQRVTQLAYREV